MEVKSRVSVNYDKLWLELFTRKINKTDMADKLGIARRTLARMGHNEAVSLDVIDRICNYLDLPIEAVITIEKNVMINGKKV